ncbi:hypothetical protein NYO91_09440 [Arhodomonas aquaeolei]|uniref:hypothetical protein n=1 Tax=Arhodomonas aquaeolei TaxID=2369 RepID=UPI002169D520|nr:hypothetical protein [Arhodomonas aquaeolei]MCS4504298.1 hypothetical protein [Arhodomonas aquaeolei]
MSTFGKLVAGFLGGLVVAFLAQAIVAMMIGGGGEPADMGNVTVFVFLGVWIASIVWSLVASRAAKAWRRMLITSGVLSFLFPISVFVFASVSTASKASAGASNAEVGGNFLGGMFATGIASFLGVLMGIVFLVIGLLVGRDKQVVYLQKESEAGDSATK